MVHLFRLALPILSHRGLTRTPLPRIGLTSPRRTRAQLLLTGDGRRAGVLQEVGALSGKNNRLKNSAVLALTIVARLFDPKQNADAAAFVAVFTCQSV